MKQLLMKKLPYKLKLLIACMESSEQVLTILQQARRRKINWNLIHKLIIRHRLHHQVYKNIKNLDLVPSAMRNSLAELCAQDKLNLLNICDETIRITQFFEQQQIKYCVVKGVAVAKTAYTAIDERSCKDIDIWVDPEHVLHACQCLASLGYAITNPKYVLKGRKYTYFSKNRDEITLYNAERKIEVELHFKMDYLGINYFKFNKVPILSIQINNNQINTLDHEYHFLYLIIHGSIHAWVRLRWLYDIKRYIDTQLVDIKQVISLSSSIKCEHLVFQTFSLLHHFFGLNNPDACAFLEIHNPVGASLAKAGYKFINTNYEFNTRVYGKMFFKYRIYLFKLAVKHEKLNALLGDWFKLDVLFERITLPDKIFWAYYIIYPLWVIMRLIQQTQQHKRQRSNKLQFFNRSSTDANSQVKKVSFSTWLCRKIFSRTTGINKQK